MDIFAQTICVMPESESRFCIYMVSNESAICGTTEWRDYSSTLISSQRERVIIMQLLYSSRW